MAKELFVFWQFNGDNRCFCQLSCPECYGRKSRTYKHYWNGNINKWEKALERLNRDLYITFSYGEALLSHGFFECVDMIGKHPNWTLNIITNFLAPDSIIERLLQSRLAKEKRLFLITCWHPEGVNDSVKSWEIFRRHLLMVKQADVPIHVMMVWMPYIINKFPIYFEWLDKNDFRVGVRRFVKDNFWNTIPLIRRLPWVAGKCKLADYSIVERNYLYASTCPKVTAYGLNLESPRGKLCNAGKDLILLKHDGTVTLCACCYGSRHELGNIFNSKFKLNSKPIHCPTNQCGGDFGMLVLPDDRFGPLPERMWRDTFISQVEGVPQSTPIMYPRRSEMLKYLEVIKRENSQSSDGMDTEISVTN